MTHTPVLLKEVVELLNVENGKVFVDATADGGGHLQAILEKLPRDGKIIGLDQDEEMIGRLIKKFNKNSRLKFITGNFRNLGDLLKNYQGKIDGILYDLGLSSWQLEFSGRGFSFLRDEPLLMTFKAELEPFDLTAEKIINDWNRKELENLIKKYGEEKYAARIVEAIIEARKRKRIRRTGELAEIIKFATPENYEKGRLHPATRTFQALRLTVNDELNVLSEGLAAGWELLKNDGRLAVISFHSLEDRIVKNFFRDKKQQGKAEILTKKPISPLPEEIRVNFRSRSAKLRVAKKLQYGAFY
ncbi:MAG: 16S rRNA (cytosine(1402)-N(4))-methyltransferase RsmH [Candidatus Niyogibacteria bacterium]|nr:16S rRNA (cytosine(1402)-N(4))-methyltransferase RsmH [Candidatus Niyogibacteria bacterium]